MWGKVLVGAVEDGDEMGFESLNRAFGKVIAVAVGGSQLVSDLLFFDAVDQVLGDFIVQALKDGFDAS